MQTSSQNVFIAIASAVLAILVLAATIFQPQFGEQWSRFITGSAAIIALAFNIPVVQATVASASNKVASLFRKQA